MAHPRIFEDYRASCHIYLSKKQMDTLNKLAFALSKKKKKQISKSFIIRTLIDGLIRHKITASHIK